jgi:GTP1/Obg family GTP-binding protein
MDKKTKKIIKAAGNEFSKKIQEKAVQFREKEKNLTLKMSNIEEMWGELIKETNSQLNDFYTEMINTMNEKEIVKKNERNLKNVISK